MNKCADDKNVCLAKLKIYDTWKTNIIYVMYAELCIGFWFDLNINIKRHSNMDHSICISMLEYGTLIQYVHIQFTRPPRKL